ncbi:MAG: hypothetical protein V1907_00180 [Candidatus Kerfeldbacteria bacterium]
MGDKGDAPFKAVLDEATAKKGTLKIRFKPKATRRVRELRNMIGYGISMSTVDERFLSSFERSGDAGGCEVAISLTEEFPENRRRFEEKVLPGIESLAPV